MQGNSADIFSGANPSIEECEKDCVAEGCSKEAIDACKAY
jgi:hypothetical protein